MLTANAPLNGEVHADGDELLYMVSGRVHVILELADGQRVVEVTGGQALVVPGASGTRSWSRSRHSSSTSPPARGSSMGRSTSREAGVQRGRGDTREKILTPLYSVHVAMVLHRRGASGTN